MKCWPGSDISFVVSALFCVEWKLNEVFVGLEGKLKMYFPKSFCLGLDLAGEGPDLASDWKICSLYISVCVSQHFKSLVH